jgi:hypothetical protein
MIEINKEVSRGKTQVKFPLLMTRSPGSSPNGRFNRESRYNRPAVTSRTAPKIARTRAIWTRSIPVPLVDKPGLHGAIRRLQSQMKVGLLSGDPALGSAMKQSQLQQVRLDDIHNGIGILPDRGSDGL